MASRYWVTGGSTTAWTDTSNWAATSGGTRGQTAPTNSDDVFFDQAATYTVTGNANALNLQVTAGTVTFNLGVSTFGGTAATTFTFNTGTVAAFTSSSQTNFQTTTSMTVTTNGVAIAGGNVYFGASTRTGSIVLGSDLSLTGTTTSDKVGFQYGTLNLNGFKLTVEGSFTTVNAVAHTLAFGSGNITITGQNSGGTFWDTSTSTSLLTVSGTPVVNVSYPSAGSGTVSTGAPTEANSISFNFTSGSYSLSFLHLASFSAQSVSFAGFSGTWVARTTANTLYGDMTLSSAAGFSVGASSGVLTFGSTNASARVITSNGKTFDGPITLNGVGGTFRLGDALLMGTTRTLTHTNGTIDLNGNTLTVGTAYTTATGTKNLTFNGGTLVCPAVTTTAFNNAVPAGFSTTAGTGTGKISMTGATAKTFVGGGSTYNCTLSNDGAGALTISGSNTFTTIANGVQPTAFVFPISVTQTVTNWTVSGTAGNLVTITSDTAGTAATLSKASGTVSSNYLSLKDSAATGGATWYAGANSTNVSGNSGWIFSNAPANAAGSFFFMF